MHVWCSRAHCLNWWIAKLFTFVVASLFAGRRDIYWIDGRVFHRQDCPIERSFFMDRTMYTSMYEGSEYHVYHLSRGSESGAQITRITFRHVLPFVTFGLIPQHFGSQKSAPFQRSPFMAGSPHEVTNLNHLADLRRWRLKGLSTSSGLHVKSHEKPHSTERSCMGIRDCKKEVRLLLSFFSALTLDLWP